MDMLNHWIENDGLAIGFILIGGALLYFIGGKLIYFFIGRIVARKGRKQPRKDIEKRQKTLASLATNVWHTVVAIVTALSIFKVIFPALDLSPLFASAGIVGIAIAFGSQALVKDFLSGLIIVSENQYRVGDVVEINSAEGRVEQLGTRTTIVRDFNGNVHYIPNGSITHIVNKTMGYSRINLSLSLAGTTDLKKVIKRVNTVGDALAGDPDWKRMILKAPQFESVDKISKASIDITITGKVQPSDQWKVTAEMRRRLLDDFAKEKIELA